VSIEHRHVSHLDALAEANDQFHWGTKVEEVEQVARRLRSLGANPALAGELESKAVRMRTVADLLRVSPKSRRQPRRSLQPAERR
jgi:hypothetical protein